VTVATVDNWGTYYVNRVKAALDGTWKSQMSWDGMGDGIIYMAPYTNMPDDVKKMAEDTASKIKSGALKPFTGPINKQDGSVWLKAGEVAGDDKLGPLNFLVEGVEGELPK